jgi:ribosomal protein S6
MEIHETTTDSRVKVYEVGYLLIPTIPEEHLAAEVQNIKAIIEKNEGVFITEDFPKLRPLAYTMRKSATGQNLKFTNAYFGWIKFEVNPSMIPTVQVGLEKNLNLLRFMLIGTVRENTLYTQRVVYRPAGEGALATDKIEEGQEAEAPKEKMSEEEIDKTIENLVVE